MSEEIFKEEENTIRSKTVPGNRNPDCLGTIDQFALLRKLGSGGYGVVYLAEDSSTHVQYALKTILPALKSSTEEMDNLKEKFAIVQKLAHPHIATAHSLHRAKEVEYASGKIAKVADVRVPGVGDGSAGLVVCEKAEGCWCIYTGVALWQVDTHQKAFGE